MQTKTSRKPRPTAVVTAVYVPPSVRYAHIPCAMTAGEKAVSAWIVAIERKNV